MKILIFFHLALQSLQADNLALLGSETHINNQKQVNEIYLSAEFNTDSTFLNSTQIQILKTIAQTCPVIGGPAVYQARSMVAAYGNYSYNDAATCAARGIAFRVHPKKENETKFSIAPNPCSSFVKVNMPEENENTTLRVFDIIGKECPIVIISSTLNSKTIDTHTLANGSYSLKIQGDKIEETLKIIILK